MTKILFAGVFIRVCFILFASTVNHLKANDDDSVECGTLSVKSGCLCPGESIVFQCAVNGSVQGLTVWKISGCIQEISLLNDNNFVNTSGPTACLNVHGVGVSILNNNCYVSELTVDNISASNNIGGNVTCSLDVGSEIPVDHRTLSVPSSDSLSLDPLCQQESPLGELSFTWEPLIITDCPSLRYNITASEGCGVCPKSVLDNVANCTSVQRGKSCTLSVFVKLCSDLIRSAPITVSTGSLPVIRNLQRSRGDPVMLTWDLVNASYCSSIDYVINATDGCGRCSVSQEGNTATCRDVRRGIVCTYFIFANVCGDHIQSEFETKLTPSTAPVSLPAGAIIGITIGVTAAVAVVITIVVGVLVVWMYRHRGHYNHFEIPRGQDESHELQQGHHNNISESHKNENERTGEATNIGESTGRPTSLEHRSRPPQFEKITSGGSCDSPGVFGRYSSKVSQVVVIGGSLKRPIIHEVTTVAVLLKENKDKFDEHIPEVTGELISDSENIPCEVNETEQKTKYELKFTPTKRGKHQLHIKVDNKHVQESPYSIVVRPSVNKLGTPVKSSFQKCKINEPGGLTVNGNGEILVVEGGNQCISIFTPDGTNRSSFGSPHLLGKQILSKPHGVAVRDDGTILVTDSGKHCISLFTPEGNFIKSVGELGSGKLLFEQPTGIGIHPRTKHIYVTEFMNNQIQVLGHDLDFIAAFGSKGSEHGEFIQPWDVSFDSQGFVYIVDSGNHRIQVFECRADSPKLKWNFIRTIGQEGRNEGQLMWPSSVFVDRENQNLVYITEDNNYRVSVFTHLGKFLKSFGKEGASPGEFDLPHGIVVDENGYIYVSDHKNNRIQVF